MDLSIRSSQSDDFLDFRDLRHYSDGQFRGMVRVGSLGVVHRKPFWFDSVDVETFLNEAALLFREPGQAFFERTGTSDHVWIRCSGDSWTVGGHLFRLDAQEDELTFEFLVNLIDVGSFLAQLRSLLLAQRQNQHTANTGSA